MFSSLCTDVVVVSPNITLFPIWEDEFSQVRLTCILSNFFPKQLTVDWYQNQKTVTDIKPTKRSLKSDEGPTSFTVTTEIEPNMEEWRKGSDFTCKAIHNSIEFQKTTSICKCEYTLLIIPKPLIVAQCIYCISPTVHGRSTPSIHVEIPTFETVMREPKVTATCFSRKVFDTKLTWLMDERPPANPNVSPRSNSTFLISELTVLSSSWKNLKTLKCKAEHRCFSAEKVVQVLGERRDVKALAHYDVLDSLCQLVKCLETSTLKMGLKHGRTVMLTSWSNKSAYSKLRPAHMSDVWHHQFHFQFWH